MLEPETRKTKASRLACLAGNSTDHLPDESAVVLAR